MGDLPTFRCVILNHLQRWRVCCPPLIVDCCDRLCGDVIGGVCDGSLHLSWWMGVNECLTLPVDLGKVAGQEVEDHAVR